MNRSFIVLIMISGLTFFQACNSEKNEDLQTLLQQRKELDERITALKKEAGADSSLTRNTRSKFVEVTEVSPTVFSHYIEVQGVADTDNNIFLTAKANGEIENVFVSEGSKVKKGQVLLKIDDDLIINSISEVKTSLAFATEMFEKQKSLWEQKIGSEVQYLQAKNNKESLESRLSTLREQLSMTRVTSPISGIVENVNIKIGEMTTPGVPLIQVVDLSEFEIKAAVAENHALAVKQGTSVEIYFPDLKGSVSAEISYVGNVIDPINRTFNIIIRMKNPDLPIKPNMVTVVRILDFQEKDGMVVPLNVIQSSSEGKFVFVASENDNNAYVAEKRKVVTELNYDGKALIKNGLNPSEKIVTFGFQDLTDGQSISF